MGLGGGEMHSFLLKHFANAMVDSIDIDQTIIHVAVAYMGVDTLLCEYYSLLNSTEGVTGMSLRLDYRIAPVDPSLQCRSRIIHGDAREFIQLLGSQFQDSPDHSTVVPTINKAEGTLFQHYDYIMFDAFAPTPFSFLTDDVPESTIMNHVMTTMSTDAMLSSIKQILVPMTGIAAFHVHIDRLYPTYLRSIHSAFGSHAVADFIISNHDHIIVGRNGPFTDPRKEEKEGNDDVEIMTVPMTTTSTVIVNYTTVFGSSITTTTSSITTVNVSTTTKTAHVYHPCEDPVGYAEYTYGLMSGRYALGTNMAVSSKHSLLCQNFTYIT